MAFPKKPGAEFLVNSTTQKWQHSPSTAGLADGRFVVIWSDDGELNTTVPKSAIRAQIFDPREAAVMLTGSGLGDDFGGTRFDDVMSGLVGDDLLHGRRGNDDLRGGVGNDMLKGGGGADRLTGGLGRDRMIGGAGADRFVFNGLADSGVTGVTRDVIRGFSQGEGDLIDLSGIEAGIIPSEQVFGFIGSSAFSSIAGELRFVQSGGNTVVQGDADGDGVKDFEIFLTGLVTLTAGDLVL